MVSNCGALETRGERNMAECPRKARRFRSAARHYLSGRQPYASRLIRRVADFVGLGPGARVLDLGCGPGMLAGAFAPLAHAVVAIDPEPEMLRIAEHAFTARNITYRQGGSENLPGDLGRFRLVTMGRSFHWMNRAETLRRLDRMVIPGGAVALFDARNAATPSGAWEERYAALVRSYAGSDMEHPRQRSPEWLRHEFILLDSAFSSVEAISVFEPLEVTAAMLIDRALSRSSSAPERLGADVDRLARDIEALVAAVSPDGRLHEVVVSTALIGRRAEDVDP
jgi:ubiquinone/menaquinone biosynthesis C-methylase UbiE